jgi:long-chain acyl-CoA synthetase
MNNNKTLKTFNEFLYENEKKWADMVYLRQPIAGAWRDLTWKETMLRARKIAAFLKSLGLKKGDRVSIFSKNCAEWFIADFAISMGGFVSVPLFATQHPDNIRYVLDHAEVKAIFVGKLDNWPIQEPGISDHIIRIAFPYENPMPAKYQWNDLLAEFKPDMDNYVPELDDLYTIMYTSGTTGNPKGAMIDYRALAHAPEMIYAEGIFTKEELNIFFSYLPLGHIFERMALEYNSILTKSTVAFTESLATFAQNLQDISPTFFIAVPRIWTQFQKIILTKMPQHKLDILLKIPIISYLIKRKIKGALGLSRSVNASGSAPLSPAVMEWYNKLGIEIDEGYGRTEDLTYVSVNKPGHQRIGTVGTVRPGIEVKIAENGEILTRSKMMMTGYYKDIEATKQVFTKDGFLKTGDEGKFDAEGNLIILGRINDSFKTDKGEFVNPIPIEGKFGENSLLEQTCLIGLNLPQPALLVVLSEPATKMDPKAVTKSLKSSLDSINPNLTKYEKVSHVFVVKEGWTPENGLLTPTLKMKRKSLHEKYIQLAQANMDNKEAVVWE